MFKRKLLNTSVSVAGALAIITAMMGLSGCATTRAIENRKLTTSTRMSDTIFLEPVAPEQQTVWIRIRNTSDHQDIRRDDIEGIIKSRLSSRGYKVTNDPTKAQYRLDASLLYVDLEKEHLTEDMALAGGFGGAVLGANLGDNSLTNTAVGGLAGAALGALAGAMFRIDTYLMVVDVQVSEKVEGGVRSETRASSKSGMSTKTKQHTGKTSDYLHHRTRVTSTAQQTNMKFEEAVPILINKFADVLGGIF